MRLCICASGIKPLEVRSGQCPEFKDEGLLSVSGRTFAAITFLARASLSLLEIDSLLNFERSSRLQREVHNEVLSSDNNNKSLFFVFNLLKSNLDYSIFIGILVSDSSGRQ